MTFDILLDVPLLEESVLKLSLTVKSQYMIKIVYVGYLPRAQPCILRYDKFVLSHDSDNVLKLHAILQVKVNQDIAPFFPFFVLDLRYPRVSWAAQWFFHLPKSTQIESGDFRNPYNVQWKVWLRIRCEG